MKIGERIRYLRESKGITQAELAQLIHISPSFMNRLEKGSSTPSLEYICSISDALDITPQDILCDLFVYNDDLSTPEKIKILVQKFPPEKQLLILDLLNYLSSRIDEL